MYRHSAAAVAYTFLVQSTAVKLGGPFQPRFAILENGKPGARGLWTDCFAHTIIAVAPY